MFEHARANNTARSAAAGLNSADRQQETTPASFQESVPSLLSPLGLSKGNAIRLQRVVGNQVVQRMLAPAQFADKPAIQREPEAAAAEAAAPEAAEAAVPQSTGAGLAVPPAAGMEAAGSAPPLAGPVLGAGGAPAGAAPAQAWTRRESARDLSHYHNYHTVYQWLKGRAETEKKSGLFSYFDELSAGEKMFAIKAMCNQERVPSIQKVKETMLTGIFTKTLDWDKFSEISREAKAKNIRNYNADQTRDYASYTAIGTSAAAGGVSGSATISAGLGAGKALGVANSVAPAAGVLSGVASISQIYNASQNYDESLSAVDKAQLIGTEGSGGLADLTRFSAGTVNSVRTFGGMAANGAATAAAGAAGIVGGAAYLAGGVAGYIENGRNQKKLNALEEQFNTRAAADQHQRELGLAAHLGGSTQAMNKSKSAATAAKGALMIAGGALLIAAAASPAGPILLAAAAIIGGIGALVKFYRKSKRKEAFVDKALQVNREMAKPEMAGAKREQVRQQLLEAQGFNSVDQCYAQLVTDLATMLYEGGVTGQDEECQSVIEGLGLKIDKAKKKPGKELIAKKLHT
ncbi:hypothetical protein ACHHV8_03525 [Paenibacillus sp. TAB 01]|uniref:hypothetical protein n=1 Tax=Paenibacillus sp. TAB 01 TaxID=3368988 RepID=UPI003750813F